MPPSYTLAKRKVNHEYRSPCLIFHCSRCPKPRKLRASASFRTRHPRPSVGTQRMDKIPWWGYVIGAGLAWGTYVPLVFFGGTELTTKPGTIGGRLASILCVGVAYFLLAVVIPVVLMA